MVRKKREKDKLEKVKENRAALNVHVLSVRKTSSRLQTKMNYVELFTFRNCKRPFLYVGIHRIFSLCSA